MTETEIRAPLMFCIYQYRIKLPFIKKNNNFFRFKVTSLFNIGSKC